MRETDDINNITTPGNYSWGASPLNAPGTWCAMKVYVRKYEGGISTICQEVTNADQTIRKHRRFKSAEGVWSDFINL